MEKKMYGMGWQRDLPDVRDYTPENDRIAKLFKKSKALKPPAAGIKKKVDLSTICSPIERPGQYWILHGPCRGRTSRIL